MSGGVIAAALLLAVLSFALAFVPRRTALAGGVLAASGVLIGALVPAALPSIAFSGTWLSLGVAALSVYWPRWAITHNWACLLFSANAGIWAGLVLVPEGGPLQVLPALLARWPAVWCIAHGWAIVPRVVTSWLLAVALLVGAIPYLVVHPGYVEDHRL